MSVVKYRGVKSGLTVHEPVMSMHYEFIYSTNINRLSSVERLVKGVVWGVCPHAYKSHCE